MSTDPLRTLAHSYGLRRIEAPIFERDAEGEAVACVVVVVRDGHPPFSGRSTEADFPVKGIMWRASSNTMLALRAEQRALELAFHVELSAQKRETR